MLVKQIHFILHADFEQPALIGEWATKNQFVTKISLMGIHPLPMLEEIDFLVIMGGPMGVYEVDKYPWIAEELRFIQKCIQSGKTVLGVCLGAQMLAAALNAKVFRNKTKEIGWLPVQFKQDVIPGLPETTIAFHWHGDTFDLPQGATWLAGSEAAQNQAFIYKDKVLALQFHIEMNINAIEAMLANCGDEIVPDKFIQDKVQIRSGLKHNSGNEAILNAIMTYLSGRIK